ncbi:putative poly(rC)-binding protein 3-like isoform X6, partial [Apostichopus japonicus]
MTSLYYPNDTLTLLQSSVVHCRDTTDVDHSSQVFHRTSAIFWVFELDDDSILTTPLFLSLQGGNTVKKFREESKAKINISDSSCPERIVTVTGSPEAIHKAFQMITDKFEEDLSSTVTSPTAPTSSYVKTYSSSQSVWFNYWQRWKENTRNKR